MVNLALYVTTVLIWGSTWYAIDFQLGVVDPSVSLVYRYLIAAAIAFVWCLLTRRSLTFSRQAHGLFLLVGIFLFGLNYLAAYQAQFYISSALNAIGFSSMVWMNLVNAYLLLGRRVTRRVYVGAALGVVGILTVFVPEIKHFSLSDKIVMGMGFSLLGTLFASYGNLASQVVRARSIPVIQANAWGMFYGALINAGVAVFRGKAFIFDPSPVYIGSLLYLAVFGSFVAFACYLTLLGRIGLERAGYAAVMIPIVALTLSAVFDEQTIGWHIIIGLGIAVAGNIFVLRSSE